MEECLSPSLGHSASKAFRDDFLLTSHRAARVFPPDGGRALPSQLSRKLLFSGGGNAPFDSPWEAARVNARGGRILSSQELALGAGDRIFRAWRRSARGPAAALRFEHGQPAFRCASISRTDRRHRVVSVVALWELTVHPESDVVKSVNINMVRRCAAASESNRLKEMMFVRYWRPSSTRTQQFIMVSSMYCQLLVVICVVFFTSEVVTARVPLYYFEGFYMYLYSVSLLFLLYVYIYLLRRSTGAPSTYGTPKKITILENLRRIGDKGSPRTPAKGFESEGPLPPRLKKQRISENDRSHGSLFLRIGAIAFGLGTMVYNGLEFGSFFEIPSTSPCYSVLLGINPVLQMVFTFAQMYFIFMNARLNIHKFKVIARFGLMHVVATNICVWIRTLGKETLQEINEHHLRNGRGSTLEELLLPLRENATSRNFSNPCEKQDIMGTIVSDSSPFLYPFIVEYSLISAAVLYVMWKNIGKDPVYHVENSHDDGISRTSSLQAGSKVNCTGSSKGLFFGLLVLVCSTICLIVFFVLIQHMRYSMLAIYLSDLSHCGIKVLTIGAITVGFFRIRSLRFHPDRKDHLRSILLSVAAFGLYVYAMFGIIAGSLLPKDHIPNLLVMVTSILTIIQVTMQSLFIADITCRMTYLPEHDHSKPGRQVITFLLIGNLTLWIIYTFEKQKVEASPVQLGFYGFMAWTVIIRASLPLSIFYRFHSSVTFAEVWKNSYRNN